MRTGSEESEPFTQYVPSKMRNILVLIMQCYVTVSDRRSSAQLPVTRLECNLCVDVK